MTCFLRVKLNELYHLPCRFFILYDIFIRVSSHAKCLFHRFVEFLFK